MGFRVIWRLKFLESSLVPVLIGEQVRVNGTFYVTYTAYNNITAQLALATSEDLLTWTKYPPLFPGYSKSYSLLKEKS